LRDLTDLAREARTGGFGNRRSHIDHIDMLGSDSARVADNAGTIQVRRDEAVELTWSADRRSVVHLHGYDIEVTVDAGKPQTMAFRARATGRFPIEMHGDRHTVLIYLEVHPR